MFVGSLAVIVSLAMGRERPPLQETGGLPALDASVCRLVPRPDQTKTLGPLCLFVLSDPIHGSRVFAE